LTGICTNASGEEYNRQRETGPLGIGGLPYWDVLADQEISYRSKEMKDTLKMRGFFRLQIEDPDGSIVGDSGWQRNTITNDGKLQYIVRALASSAGSKYLSYAALGEGTEPAAAGTSLESEVLGTQGSQIRDAMTMESNGSTALRCTGTFASGDSFITAAAGESIANIGLFRSSTGGTIFAGNTYASSSCATNQNVNYTYDITLT
jgi:hypothetical protein